MRITDNRIVGSPRKKDENCLSSGDYVLNGKRDLLMERGRIVKIHLHIHAINNFKKNRIGYV